MSDVASHDGRLTDELARRVMGWGVHPDRYVKSGRTWIARWRFQPMEHLDDAFALLDRSQSRYTIQCESKEAFTVRVRIDRRIGSARSGQKARAICLALGRALQLDGFGDQTDRPSRTERGSASKGGLT